MSSFPLARRFDDCVGTVTLKSPSRTTVTYWEQIRLELANGEFKWTQPIPVSVPFGRGIVPTLPTGPQQPLADNAPAPVGKDGGWLGGDAAPQPATGAGKGLQGVISRRWLLGVPQTEAGATYRDVNVGGKVTPTMQWSNDGKFVYLLEENGMLHKVSVPEFREDRVLQMDQKTTFMVLTSRGLAIGLPLLQEVWLVSSDTLQLQKRIPVGQMSRLAGSPALPFVYAAQVETLSVVDLVAGKVTAQIHGRDITHPGVSERPYGSNLGGFFFASVTPDGKYFLCADGGITRLLIGKDGTTLTYEDSGPDISSNSNPQSLQISSDSRYVAVPCGGGNHGVTGFGPYVTYVYKIDDLQTPVMVITSGAYPRILGFDKAAGYVYAQGQATLMIYTAAGLRQKTFDLKPDTSNPRPGGFGGSFGGGFGGSLDTQQFLPHPSGRKLLVLMGARLVWVELPSPDQMAQDIAPTTGQNPLQPPFSNFPPTKGGFGF